MGDRRMISKKITDTDKFLAMPLSTQALYFHLNTHGDDYGFVDKAKTIQRTIGASEDDLKLLIAKQYIIPFESGVVVIKDWFIHNIIRKDRLKETSYIQEKQQLQITESRTYEHTTTNCQPTDNQLSTNWRPNLTKPNLTQPNLTKPSKDYILSGTPDFTFPKWLDEKAINEIQKGNPQNYEQRIPIAYLNQKLDKNYKYVEKNTKLVKTRLNEGYTLDDFKTVIDKKVAEWQNNESMAKYLRPETLFGTKFDGYLNQPTAKSKGYDNDIDLPF